MRCHVCGSDTDRTFTNLPFGISDSSIVILKDLPVYQCCGCRKYLSEDSVLSHIGKISDKTDAETELEIVRYAA